MQVAGIRYPRIKNKINLDITIVNRLANSDIPLSPKYLRRPLLILQACNLCKSNISNSINDLFNLKDVISIINRFIE